ncbi:MAG: S9 family peptidase [Candidatus Eisenbacteria sp.]|nr:S9 family peptidase [Candidatus Eisenbacteria bacterium]
MRQLSRALVLGLASLLLGAALGTTGASLLTPELRLQMARVGRPVASPDGQRVVYTLSQLDPEEQSTHTHIWLLDLRTGTTRQLTRGTSAHSPAWTPDGEHLTFMRSGQVWRLPFAGGEPEQVTDLPGQVADYRMNPNPQAPARLRMAISRRVHPDCPVTDWDCSARARERWDERPGLVTELFPLRHWSSWRDSLVSHVYVGDPEGDSWMDLTSGVAPRAPLALAWGDEYIFSPDGRQMALIRNPDPDEATSTNNDIFLMDLHAALDHGPGSVWEAAHLLSRGLSGGGGNDDAPCFSPDNRWIAYTSMRRPGYESDLREIVLQDRWTGDERCLTCGLDRSASGLAWSHDARFLYFTAYDQEACALYRVRIKDSRVQKLLRAGSIGGIEPLPDGRVLFLMGSSRMPPEIFLCDPEVLASEPEQLTFHNWDLLRDLEMNPVEHFWFAGAMGDSVHGIILRPPQHSGPADSRPLPGSPLPGSPLPGGPLPGSPLPGGPLPGRLSSSGLADSTAAKDPLVLVLHGGPQWAYHDFWLRSYNFQMIAAQGYVVATINFHGSAGFGIAFQDAIREHWGDIPGEDVERGLDYIFAHYDFVDSTRVAAIGRSYGGYLVNWLNGCSRRFRCFVSHSGSYDEAAAWGTTEELWFPEWEFRGPPWEYRDLYAANSPASFAGQMRTPTLIIHGQRDYRVDLSNGLQIYAVLQRQGTTARFLTYPKEGHHIHDPRAWRFMWKEIFSWLGRFLD